MMSSPIQPSPEAIAEFKKIFKDDYGKELTDEEASEAAYDLLNFFKLLLEVDQGIKSQNSDKANDHQRAPGKI